MNTFLLSRSLVAAFALMSVACWSRNVDDPLDEAIKTFDVARVRTLLAEGIKPSSRHINLLIVNRGDESKRIELYHILMSDPVLKKSMYSRGLYAEIAKAVSHDSLGFVDVLHREITEKFQVGVDVQSLLYIAVRQSSYKMVEKLLGYGANPNVPVKKDAGIVYVDMPTPYQATVYALSSAAYLSRKDVAELLIARGADINIQDADGESALHSAALKPNNEEMIRFLVSRGANHSLKTHRHETALEIAVRKGYTSNIEALRAK